MNFNDFLTNIAVKLNMVTIKNDNNLSLKEEIRKNLHNERILSINVDGECAIVRIILSGNRDDLLFNKEDEVIQKAKQISSQIKEISPIHKIYLIDEKYKIIIILDQDNNIAYHE